MQFSVLGPVTLSGANGATAVPAPRLQQVLALLLMARGTVVPVSTLAADLWPAGGPPTVRTTLRTYVHDLRGLLRGCDCALRTTGSGYRLLVPEQQVDAFVFGSLLARARTLLAGPPIPDRLAEADRLLRRGLALWRGTAFAGVPAGPTLEAHLAALQADWRRAVGLRVHVDLLLGRHSDLIGELKGLVSEFPLDEDFHAQLMVALYRCGRRGEALRVYEQHRRTLRAELGADVPPRLHLLRRRIVAAEDPQGAARDRDVPPSSRGTAARPAPRAQRPGRPAAVGGRWRPPRMDA